MADDYGTLSPYSDLYQPSASELARNRAGPADRPGYSHLGSALGAMFFGGGEREARGQRIATEAATGEVKLQDLIMQARKDRDAEIGRQSAIQKALDEGNTELANMIRNSPNAASAEEARLHAQSRSWGDESWKLANSPAGATDEGLELQARQAGVRAPASMKDLTKIEGGLGVNPLRVPGHQPDKFETPESQSAGNLRASQAAEADARTKYIQGPQTQSERALTAQRMREGREATAQNLPEGEKKAYFSDGSGLMDVAKANEFQRFMLDNGLTDERKAYRLYVKLHPEQAPPEEAPPEEPPSGLKSLFNSIIPPEMQKTLFGGLGTDVARAVGAGGGKPAPFPEGTKGTMNGKRYIVKNGQLVPLKEGPGVSATVTSTTHTIPTRKKTVPE